MNKQANNPQFGILVRVTQLLFFSHALLLLFFTLALALYNTHLKITKREYLDIYI